jgi:hypothetical protein
LGYNIQGTKLQTHSYHHRRQISIHNSIKECKFIGKVLKLNPFIDGVGRKMAFRS